jgi:hypothetical protein
MQVDFDCAIEVPEHTGFYITLGVNIPIDVIRTELVVCSRDFFYLESLDAIFVRPQKFSSVQFLFSDFENRRLPTLDNCQAYGGGIIKAIPLEPSPKPSVHFANPFNELSLHNPIVINGNPESAIRCLLLITEKAA